MFSKQILFSWKTLAFIFELDACMQHLNKNVDKNSSVRLPWVFEFRQKLCGLRKCANISIIKIILDKKGMMKCSSFRYRIVHFFLFIYWKLQLSHVLKLFFSYFNCDPTVLILVRRSFLEWKTDYFPSVICLLKLGNHEIFLNLQYLLFSTRALSSLFLQ